MALELGAASVQRRGELGSERRHAALRVGPVEHDHARDTRERRGDRLAWQRTKRRQLEQAGGLALVAQLVDDVLDGTGGRAERDDGVLGAVEAIRLDDVIATAGQLRELVGELGEDPERRRLRGRLLPAKLVVVVRHRKGTMCRRHGSEERMRDRVVAGEGPHGLVGQQLDRLGGVHDREAVETDRDRQQHLRMLGEARRQHGQVVRLLRVLGEELHDPRVAHEHRVGVVAVDVDRPRERAVESPSAVSQPPVDRVRGELRLAHRLDDARAAVDSVAAAKTRGSAVRPVTGSALASTRSSNPASAARPSSFQTMSPTETTPMTEPSAAQTGTPEISFATSSAATSFNGVSGLTDTTAPVMTSAIFIGTSLHAVAAAAIGRPPADPSCRVVRMVARRHRFVRRRVARSPSSRPRGGSRRAHASRRRVGRRRAPPPPTPRRPDDRARLVSRRARPARR